MQVGMYYKNSDVRIEELTLPSIGSDELLLKVEASGICGSDVMEWYRIKSAPRVLGHEVAGEIAAVGSAVEKFTKGQRVVVAHHVPCNTCRYCMVGEHTLCDTLRTTNFDPGGFAQYLRVPAINVDRGVFPLPDGVSYDEGTIVEPLGCVVRGLRKASIRPGQSVLVIGSGISGLLNIQMALFSGAGRVMATDIQPSRLKAALELGAFAAFDAREDVPALVKEHNGGRLADLVVINAGAPAAIQQAFRCVDRGGTLLLFAVPEKGMELPLPIHDMWKDGVKFIGTYGAGPQDMAQSIEIIESGRLDLDKMITHNLPLKEIQRGFQLVESGEQSIKVIIHPHL